MVVVSLLVSETFVTFAPKFKFVVFLGLVIFPVSDAVVFFRDVVFFAEE